MGNTCVKSQERGSDTRASRKQPTQPRVLEGSMSERPVELIDEQLTKKIDAAKKPSPGMKRSDLT